MASKTQATQATPEESPFLNEGETCYAERAKDAVISKSNEGATTLEPEPSEAVHA